MKSLLVAAGLVGFASVALGAFGAHGLEDRLSDEAMAWWDTATLYGLSHSVAALAIAVSAFRGLSQFAGWAFVVGVVVFSGSLYALALSDIRMLGAITPIGGVAFLLGWGSLVVAGLRR